MSENKNNLYLVTSVGTTLFFVRADSQEEANMKALQAIHISKCIFNEIPDGYAEYVGTVRPKVEKKD